MSKKSEVNLIWRGKSAERQLGKEAIRRLDALGHDIVPKIKLFLSQLGTGRMYKTGKTAWHQASAPGFPPVVWGGELKGTFGHVVVDEGKIVYLYIGTPKDYGLYLEIGTVKMEARPWLSVILVTLSPEFLNFLIKEWKII